MAVYFLYMLSGWLHALSHIIKMTTRKSHFLYLHAIAVPLPNMTKTILIIRFSTRWLHAIATFYIYAHLMATRIDNLDK